MYAKDWRVASLQKVAKAEINENEKVYFNYVCCNLRYFTY